MAEDPQAKLEKLIQETGGIDELLELWDDSRRILREVVKADDARSIMPKVYAFFSHKQINRLAQSLNDQEATEKLLARKQIESSWPDKQ